MPKRSRLRFSLIVSFWDGVFASVMFGIVEQFATPLALFFGADSTAIGLLNFVRGSLVSIVQVVSTNLTAFFKSRKRVVTTAVFWGAWLWLPTYFLPFYCGGYKVLVFLLLFAAASSLNTLPTPAWASMLTEHIPPSKRGQYFGWRAAVLGLVYSGAVAVAGLVLFLSRDPYWGFAALIITAWAARFISWYFLTLMYEPRLRQRREDYFTLRAFLRQIGRSNFARFSVLSAIYMAGVSISSPFIAIYLLNELGLDYLMFTILVLAAVVTSFVGQRYWGKVADRYGNMKVVRLAGLLASLVPLLWIVSGNVVYLFVVQLLAGWVWAGYNLTTVNFVYDAAIPAKRERCLSYYNFLSGIGLGIGALLGGWLYKVLPPMLGSSYFPLLCLSSLARLLAMAGIVMLTREVRRVLK